MTAITTTLKVFEFLNLNTKVPSHADASVGNTLETVDTSGTLNVNSVVYLDHDKVIDNTLTLSAGTSLTATQATLTKDTDYSINLDEGKITVLATATIATKSLFAKYNYNPMIVDSIVADIISRQTNWLNDALNQTFGTSYLVEKEEHLGQGEHNRIYRVKNLPLKQWKSQLAFDVATATIAITVDNTTGLTVGDVVSIGEEPIKVTTILSSTAFQATRGYGNTASIASHSIDDWLTNMVVEISNANVGFEPTWSQSEFRSDFDADSNTGAVQLLHIDSEDLGDLSTSVYPPNRVFNRVRLTYRYGEETVPSDVEGLVIRLVARELVDRAISRAFADGANQFQPNVLDTLDKSIAKMMNEHKLLLTGGN